VVDAEFGKELLSDLVLAPLEVIARDPLDESDMLPGDGGTTDLAGARPATPEDPEPSAVPLDYGCRLDDDEGASPVRPEPAAGNPEDTILGPQSNTPAGSLVHGQLLAEGGVLERESRPRHPGCPQAGEQR
jgi:hypothetical protein